MWALTPMEVDEETAVIAAGGRAQLSVTEGAT